MKRLLPLLAVTTALAACNMNDNDRYNNRTGEYVPEHVVRPAAVVTPAPAYEVRPDGSYTVRPDGSYYYAPATVATPVRGHQHTHAEDALSDRSLGATRGSRGQPMTHKDADNDGNYDFVPEYRTRSGAYYYGY